MVATFPPTLQLPAEHDAVASVTYRQIITSGGLGTAYEGGSWIEPQNEEVKLSLCLTN
jgi:hypothetical protein